MNPWTFLRDADNRGALGAIGAVIATLVGSIWAVCIYFRPSEAFRWETACEIEVGKWWGTWKGKSGVKPGSSGVESLVYFESANKCELTLGFINGVGEKATQGHLVGGVEAGRFVGRAIFQNGTPYATFEFKVRADGRFEGSYVIFKEDSQEWWGERIK